MWRNLRMKINFDNIPTSKPGAGDFKQIEPGTYPAQVHKAEIKTAASGNDYLSVSFITPDKAFVNEAFTTGDKPFLIWKIGQLLKACDVQLEGEGELSTIPSLIVGKKVEIDATVNDRGYTSLDFSGDKTGVRPRATAEPTPVVEQSNDSEF